MDHALQPHDVVEFARIELARPGHRQRVEIQAAYRDVLLPDLNQEPVPDGGGGRVVIGNTRKPRPQGPIVVPLPRRRQAEPLAVRELLQNLAVILVSRDRMVGLIDHHEPEVRRHVPVETPLHIQGLNRGDHDPGRRQHRVLPRVQRPVVRVLVVNLLATHLIERVSGLGKKLVAMGDPKYTSRVLRPPADDLASAKRFSCPGRHGQEGSRSVLAEQPAVDSLRGLDLVGSHVILPRRCLRPVRTCWCSTPKRGTPACRRTRPCGTSGMACRPSSSCPRSPGRRSAACSPTRA